MDKRPRTIDNIITGLPEREPSAVVRLTALARAVWRAVKMGSELFGVFCFLAWLADQLSKLM